MPACSSCSSERIVTRRNRRNWATRTSITKRLTHEGAMLRYPMTAIVAEREYELREAGRVAKVTVSLGTPGPFPDAPAGDWYCPYRVSSPEHVHEFFAGGVDALQAMLMAISAIRVELQL